MKIEPKKAIILTAEEIQAMRVTTKILCDLSEKLDFTEEYILNDLIDTNFNTIFSSNGDYPIIIEH